MSRDQAAFSFDLNESLYFRSGEEVGEMVSISLEPIISVHSPAEYVQLRGVIELKGEYRRGENGHADYVPIDEEEDDQAIRRVEEVSETEDGELTFLHHFPIEISIPHDRVEDLNEIKVQVTTFDYDFPSNDRLNLLASIEIRGILPEEQRSEPELLTEEKDLPLPFFGAEDIGADALEELMGKLATFSDQLPQFDFDIIPEAEEIEPSASRRDEEPEALADNQSNTLQSAFLTPEQEIPKQNAKQSEPANSTDRYSAENSEQTDEAKQSNNCETELASEASEHRLELSNNSTPEENDQASLSEESCELARSEQQAEEEQEPALNLNSKAEKVEREEVRLDSEPSAEEAKPQQEEAPSAVENDQNLSEAESTSQELAFTAARDQAEARKQEEQAEARDQEPSELQTEAETENQAPSAEEQPRQEEQTESDEVKISASEPVGEAEDVKEAPAVQGRIEQQQQPEANQESAVEQESTPSADADESSEAVNRPEQAESEQEESEQQESPVYKKQRTETGIHAQKPDEEGADLGNLTDLFGRDNEEGFTRMRLYIVQEKDTIESIAERYEIPVSRLLQHNRLDNENLGAGQLIYIPVPREANA
ncbi:LysM peptidoglycan-binding domain-containing protein [Aciduricibacillus chroicocephali]|uniref:LysM peptidoglycan-binding domain-containing protein n=1 Tax=Aciduricibacillus chroicocephali TaxID=3054939 RepID=A0ABY9KSL2_9BACI|nr:LysM peptidoglycan-binding domain-containing protein [Bacillaceae bacterium 44XB]